MIRSQRGAFLSWFLGFLVIAALLLAGWIVAMLNWSYSNGEKAGWVQTLSKSGYVCKTWEGEMAMVSLPGSMPEKFLFTVWDDKVAEDINRVMGKRVSLLYEEHILLPTSCFGETRRFVKGVKVIDDTPAPMIIPTVPGQMPAPRVDIVPQSAPAPQTQ